MHIITGMLLAGLAGLKKNKNDKGSHRLPRFNTGPVQTVHSLPGRLRLRVPSLSEDEDARKTVAEHMPRIKGVDLVEISPVTGSVLVLYEQNELEPELLFAALVRLLGFDEELEGSPTPILTRELKTMGESLNRAVYEQTGGVIDLWSAILILLAGLGIRSMVRNPAQAFPAGFALLWWGLNGIRRSG
jgi:hypothetical protein